MKHSVVLALLALVVAGAAGKPHKVERKSVALEFSFEWSAEAAAIPTLDLRFYKEAKKALADAQANALDDQAQAKQDQRDFMGHYHSTDWTTVGQTARLLSLEGTFEEFTGGAHPNHGFDALLWDRQLNREISLASLFIRPSDLAAGTRSLYCRALDKERSKRREGEKPDLDEFNQCPKYSDLAIAPVDKNKNGRFDAIEFIASPYVAGPYVEGEYEILLPVTSRLTAALKPDYRASFEAQRQ